MAKISESHLTRVLKNLGFWYFTMGSGFWVFAENSLFWLAFGFSLYIGNIKQNEFIQAITESNYSLKTTKLLSATYKPYLKQVM